MTVRAHDVDDDREPEHDCTREHQPCTASASRVAVTVPRLTLYPGMILIVRHVPQKLVHRRGWA